MIGLTPDVEHVLDAIYPAQRQALAVELAALEIRIFVASSALELALLFGYFFSGAAAHVRGFFEDRIRRRYIAAAAFVAASFAGFAIVFLPLDWYAGFTVPHAVGLSAETPATWFHDWAVGDVVSLAVLLLVALLFIAAVRGLGRRWTIAAAAAAAPLIVFGNAIFPVYVAPLFNTYVPMPPSPLKDRILALAAREGVDASAVYEYDMSLQTNEGDAYVAGIGPTARIAVGDTLLRALKPDEVLYVVAHEMGHYKLRHIWWGSLCAWLGALVAIAFIAVAGAAAVRRAGPARVRGLDDPAALVLVAALLAAFSLATQPAISAVSRSIESAADAFAASQTHLGDAGVRAFARLGSQDLSVPHPAPVVVWYFFTHPPLDERLMYAAAHATSAVQPPVHAPAGP